MKRTRDRGILANAALMIVWGLAAGVAVAAAAFPAFAVAGLGAKYGAETFEDLPSELREEPLAQISYVYAADNETLLTSFYEESRRYVPLSQVAPVMIDAIVAAEDQRFWEHNGVDLRGVIRALVANHQAGEVSQGASTLTMQYVRNALVYSADTPQEIREATEDTAIRKLREMRYAVQLEQELSKEEILERYLNIAYFGHRAYGIYGASRIYFSKDPSDLNVQEAALLAGLVRAPSAYDPASGDGQAALERRNWVLDQMVETGALTPQEAAAAQATPIELRLSTIPNDCVSAAPGWGFFCDFFRNWWLSQEEFGQTAAERENLLRRGGFRIVTSLHPGIQQLAERYIAAEEIEPHLALGAVFIEPGTGLVRAMAINRNYSLDQSNNGPHTDPARRAAGVRGNYPNTVVPLLGGGETPGYQAGSTFKMFTMLAALEQGIQLDTSFYSPARYVSRFIVEPGGPAACGNRWCPQNAGGRTAGVFNMWTGFGRSVNTYFVQLVERVGPENAVRMAERLGLTWRDPEDARLAANAEGWGAFTIGVPNTTPLEMANAFATVAAEGLYCEPRPVQQIFDRDGEEVPVPQFCEQRIDPEVARAATDAARCPVGDQPLRGSCEGGTASRVGTIMGNRPVAGKTGTTDSNRAAWFIGYTPQLAGAAFLADPDYRLTEVEGTRPPVSVVAYTLRDALRGREIAQFNPPPDRLVRGGQQASVPTPDSTADEGEDGDQTTQGDNDRRQDQNNRNNDGQQRPVPAPPEAEQPTDPAESTPAPNPSTTATTQSAVAVDRGDHAVASMTTAVLPPQRRGLDPIDP